MGGAPTPKWDPISVGPRPCGCVLFWGWLKHGQGLAYLQTSSTPLHPRAPNKNPPQQLPLDGRHSGASGAPTRELHLRAVRQHEGHQGGLQHESSGRGGGQHQWDPIMGVGEFTTQFRQNYFSGDNPSFQLSHNSSYAVMWLWVNTNGITRVQLPVHEWWTGGVFTKTPDGMPWDPM